MLDDLLTFSRLGFDGAGFGMVDLNDVVQEVVQSYQTQLNEIGADVILHQLPTVPGDRLQLSRVMQNLIGNAIKFRSKVTLELQVGARDEADQWRISVKDNGISIAPEQLERIFGMFQRLHSSEEIPGNGMGLAICKRIVENHGGRIWARSWPGKGSSFYFTLPKTADSR
jgi:signal transduction histidine kinase